jgi:hypothetical protein
MHIRTDPNQRRNPISITSGSDGIGRSRPCVGYLVLPRIRVCQPIPTRVTAATAISCFRVARAAAPASRIDSDAYAPPDAGHVDALMCGVVEYRALRVVPPVRHR